MDERNLIMRLIKYIVGMAIFPERTTAKLLNDPSRFYLGVLVWSILSKTLKVLYLKKALHQAFYPGNSSVSMVLLLNYLWRITYRFSTVERHSLVV